MAFSEKLKKILLISTKKSKKQAEIKNKLSNAEVKETELSLIELELNNKT